MNPKTFSLLSAAGIIGCNDPLRPDREYPIEGSTIANQEVTLTVPDSTHIQLTVTGPLSENLAADMISAYPGWGEGDWTCGPQHPLARVQPGIVLTGKWRTQPIVDLPIG
jgi:hypothetical protein